MLSALKIGLASFMISVGAANSYTTISYPDPNIFSGVIQPHIAEASTRNALTEDQVKELIKKYAEPLHVNKRSMLETIKCESPRHDDGTFNPDGQSLIIEDDGKQETSYGIAQIHLPHNPTITLEQAKNPEYAISFMATEFSQGHAMHWTCWRLLKESGKI